MIGSNVDDIHTVSGAAACPARGPLADASCPFLHLGKHDQRVREGGAGAHLGRDPDRLHQFLVRNALQHGGASVSLDAIWTMRPEDHVEVDWGDDFAANYHAAFPDALPGTVSISYGPLALDYVLAQGGSGYFRMAAVRPFLEDGRLVVVTDAPEFSYSAYVVHSTGADESVTARVRRGLRAAAEQLS